MAGIFFIFSVAAALLWGGWRWMHTVDLFVKESQQRSQRPQAPIWLQFGRKRAYPSARGMADLPRSS